MLRMIQTICLSSAPPNVSRDKVLRLPGVKSVTGLSRSSIYAGVRNGTFPAPMSLGQRAVGWAGSELLAWIEARKTARKQEVA
jgi:prophage regulatory protein